MRILLINKFLYPVGGAETYMFKLGRYLQNLGHEVQYFGMKDDRNIVGNHANSYVEAVDYHSRKQKKMLLLLSIETIFSRQACNKVKLVLDDFKPDIVHMNNINFQLTPAIIYEIKKKQIPVIQTVHDVQIACPCHRFYIEHEHKICKDCKNGKFYWCMLHKCVQGSLLKSLVASIESYFYHWKNTYNLVDCYICPSQFMADQITEAGIEKRRVQIMYNFSDVIDTSMLAKDKSDYVLYFGRFSYEKGIKTLMDVTEQLRDIKFVFAGSGPLDDDVKEHCKKNTNCFFAGFKTGPELQTLISKARFSVYPSEWYENCPLSVIESQSLGTPVVGSDLGGTKELIHDGYTGVVFEGGSAAELKRAVERLYHDPDRLKQMSENCTKEKIMRIDRYVAELMQIYEKNMERKAVPLVR